jgi:hypothetical protein
MASDDERFRVSGTIEEAETGRPLADLIVRAFDRDLISDDRLGFATTDESGRFEIQFARSAFSSGLEAQPDLYLRIFDREGTIEIHETTDAIRWNASNSEHYRVRIPAKALHVLGTR